MPVLTIDGPGGAGKGTVSRAIARKLGWHYLDSGAIYRALAIAVLRKNISLDDEAAIAKVAEGLNLSFQCNEKVAVLLDNDDISEQIQSETCGYAASKIAIYPAVRKALLQKQREFQKAPGLVADGRDMGTIVFPKAPYKVFLTARAGVRAERRYKQLKEKGIDVSLDRITRELEERDRRDRERANAPLVKADDAILIDSSDLTINEAIDKVLNIIRRSLIANSMGVGVADEK